MTSEEMMKLIKLLEEVLERLKKLEEKLNSSSLSREEVMVAQELISL